MPGGNSARVLQRHRHQFGRVRAEVAQRLRVVQRQVVGVVVQPAGVLQQLPHGDPLVRQQTRQVPLDRRVQLHPAFGDELQHDGGDERLGDAARAEGPVARERFPGGDVTAAAAHHARPAAVLDRPLRRPERRPGRSARPGSPWTGLVVVANAGAAVVAARSATSVPQATIRLPRKDFRMKEPPGVSVFPNLGSRDARGHGAGRPNDPGACPTTVSAGEEPASACRTGRSGWSGRRRSRPAGPSPRCAPGCRCATASRRSRRCRRPGSCSRPRW